MKNWLSLFIAMLLLSALPAQTAPKSLRMSFSEGEAVIRLEENDSARSLTAMLPLKLEFNDYNDTEKISYPPKSLSTEGAPDSYEPKAGDLCLYTHWGDLCIFYRNFSRSRGLIHIGHLVSGLDALSKVKGKFTATLNAE